jgi:hypothetical protein
VKLLKIFIVLLGSPFILLFTTFATLAFTVNTITRLLGIQSSETKELEVENTSENILLIPTSILYDAFSKLMEHGKNAREWIVALGYQQIDGKKVVTHVYNLNCTISRFTGAEADYGNLAKAMSFYELCGGNIVAIVHIHPWHSGSVSPSLIDIETQKRWEEFYKGEFLGIVFNNSGVFRIFMVNSRLKPVIVGKGVRRIGSDLYELERIL